jgi:hypothetical protein
MRVREVEEDKLASNKRASMDKEKLLLKERGEIQHETFTLEEVLYDIKKSIQ